MGQLRLVWIIALKDLKLFTRDRMALFFFVLFPFLFIFMFNFIYAGVGSEDERLVFHLVTLEEDAEGALSHQIIAALETPDESVLQPGEPQVIREDDYDELRRQVEDKELGGFLAFPEGFTERVYMGGGAEIEVVADPEAVSYRAALYGLAQGISSWIGAEYTVRGAIIELAAIQLRYSRLLGDVRLLCSRPVRGGYCPRAPEPYPGAYAGQFGTAVYHHRWYFHGYGGQGAGADNHLLDGGSPGFKHGPRAGPGGRYHSLFPDGNRVGRLRRDAGHAGKD